MIYGRGLSILHVCCRVEVKTYPIPAVKQHFRPGLRAPQTAGMKASPSVLHCFCLESTDQILPSFVSSSSRMDPTVCCQGFILTLSNFSRCSSLHMTVPFRYLRQSETCRAFSKSLLVGGRRPKARQSTLRPLPHTTEFSFIIK